MVTQPNRAPVLCAIFAAYAAKVPVWFSALGYEMMAE
jgi:hypothetical protein